MIIKERKSDIAFITTVFPAIQNYLKDFLNSLTKQSYKNFDVVVANDGLYQLDSLIKKHNSLNFLCYKVNGTPAKNREFIIKKTLQEGYKYMIFGDADDYFSENRVENTMFALSHADIVFNDITLFDDNRFTRAVFSNYPQCTKNVKKNILEGNVLGFSNTALKSEILNNEFIYDKNLIAVDWFFYTNMILNKKDFKINFIKNAQTYYRQYVDNTVGMSFQLNEEKLFKGINVKRKHFLSLKRVYDDKRINKHLESIESLETILQNKKIREEYIEVVNRHIEEIFTGWWSNIISLTQFEKLRNHEKNKVN